MVAVRKYQLRNARKILKWARKYYAEHRARIGANRRRRYELTEPKPLTKENYIREITKKLISNSHASRQMLQSFKDQHEKIALKMTAATSRRAASSIAATRLVNKVLQIRRHLAGSLLKMVRAINKLSISTESDLGEGSHCVHGEPYYYESSYVHNRPSIICIDEHGKYRLLDDDKNTVEHVVPRSWKCNDTCRTLSQSDLSCIIEFKSVFNESLQKIRKVLDECDECPNSKYAKVIIVPANEPDSNVVHYNSVELKGHSLICHIGSDCKSKLRILRAASTHYPVLRSFLRCVYSALNSHKNIASLDEALHRGDFNSLMRDFEITFDDLFSNEVNLSHELESSFAKCVLRRPDLEKHLQIEHAEVMAKYKKELEDYPQNPCCSCNMLFCLKQGSKITFSTELGNVWPDLKDFILKDDPNASKKTLFICTYCRSYLRSNKMPPRCVLNGLQTSPIPRELSVLDELSKQLIQRAKAFQTIVRLGTYTNKVPSYNSLKACKGNMFFLPLPLDKTLETLDGVEGSLANPELYIIVNSKPTKGNVVWRSLVDVNQVKAAIKKLKECNWLYKDVCDESVDSAAKEVIEVVSNTSSTVLEKASSSDIAGFQCYTLRDMNDKLSTKDDLQQYKMLSVQEEPLSSTQRHLDTMCFPVLFPDGNFGKYHPRQVPVSHS